MMDIHWYQQYIQSQQRQQNQQGGRKRKTRKKRGGNIDIERDAYIYRLIQPLHLSLQDQIDRHNTRIQELEQWQEAYEDLNLEERIVALESLRSGTGGTGGGKRKKKTRKKRGGMERNTSTPETRPTTPQTDIMVSNVPEPLFIPPLRLPPPALVQEIRGQNQNHQQEEMRPPPRIRTINFQDVHTRANSYERHKQIDLRNELRQLDREDPEYPQNVLQILQNYNK